LLRDAVVRVVDGDPSFESQPVFSLVMAASGRRVDRIGAADSVLSYLWCRAQKHWTTSWRAVRCKTQGVSVEAMLRSIACLTLIPTIEFIDQRTIRRARAWLREYADASAHCAHGQLAAWRSTRTAIRGVAQCNICREDGGLRRTWRWHHGLNLDGERIARAHCGHLFGVYGKW